MHSPVTSFSSTFSMLSLSLHDIFSFTLHYIFLFSLVMITFYKKNIYSFLYNLIYSKDQGTVFYCSPIHNLNINIPSVQGLSFITVLKTQPSVNLVGSAAIKPPLLPTISKRDPGGIGFLDVVSGSVNGLMSCTESLGFESSDERRFDDQMAEDFPPIFSSRISRRNDNVKREDKKFPPPLSSLDCNGKPTFFLRPVRTNGRLEITKVKIHRPEILHASRQDGRLRLDFIVDEGIQTIDEDIEGQNEDKIEESFEEMSEEREEKEEKGLDQWRFLAKSGSESESFRWCHERSHCGRRRHHHHHKMHVWSTHPCVTIR